MNIAIKDDCIHTHLIENNNTHTHTHYAYKYKCAQF